MIAQGNNGHHEIAPYTPTPGEVAKAITGRDYLSYSQVTTYQACPLKWSYTYVQNAPKEHVSAALLLGSGVHAAIEYHLQALMAAEPAPSVNELMEVFDTSWKEGAGDLPVQYSQGETRETQLELARRMIESFGSSEQAKVTGELIGIEEELRTKLTEDLPDLIAVLDRIELRDNELVITDYKTARSSWGESAASEHAEQLVLYGQSAQAVADDLNAKVRLEFVVITKAKSPKVQAINIPYEPHRTKRSLRVMQQVFRSMQTGLVYPSPSAMNCGSCPYRDRCSLWHA